MFRTRLLLTVFGLMSSACCAASSVSNGCVRACDAIADSTDIPLRWSGDPPTLWSKFQAEVRPHCTVEPQSASQIAQVLEISRVRSCHFAVLAGGTAPFKNASNAEGGITINLKRLRSLQIRKTEPPTVTVGAGLVWADLYAALGPLNASVTGTRNSLSGVTGSILGGGISFFSEHHGWACDTVTEFEVVLANSSVIRTSTMQHPELFWALKGGGNNFGIVSEVVLEAFGNPPEWYSFQRFDMAASEVVFHRLERNARGMPDGVWQIAVSIQWHIPTQQFVLSERTVSSQRLDLPHTLTQSLQNGTEQTAVVLQTNDYKRSTLEMAQKMDAMNEPGYYNLFGTITIKSNAGLSDTTARIFQDEVTRVKGKEDLETFIVYNPITRKALKNMRSHGGNALGLSEADGPLTIINITVRWSNPDDDLLMRTFMRALLNRFRQAALDASLLHPYLFLNHAFEEQDVFPGYGDANLKRLRAVRRQVDPAAVFQRLQPGYFKLGEGEEEHAYQDVKDEL